MCLNFLIVFLLQNLERKYVYLYLIKIHSMNILLVDDETIFLQSLAPLISKQIFGATVFEASSGKMAIDMLAETKPDIILLDVNMPVMNGLQVAEYISKKHPDIKIVMLTNVDGDAMILSLVKIVHGFLIKDIDKAEVKECISMVMNGKKYFCDVAQRAIYENMNAMEKSPYVHLDERELELIRYLAQGKTSKQIAAIKGIKEKTVNSNREALNKKTKTTNAAGLVAYAFHNGLI